MDSIDTTKRLQVCQQIFVVSFVGCIRPRQQRSLLSALNEFVFVIIRDYNVPQMYTHANIVYQIAIYIG